MNHPNVTLDVVKQFNMLYEMTSPVACSGMLWAMANGTVLHGRNMDYNFHVKMPDGSNINIWPHVTFQATFWKAGKPLYVSTHWPMEYGIHTGMRLGGWSFEQNTRTAKQDVHKNLAAAHAGGQLFGGVVRKTMEKNTDFDAAVQVMTTTMFVAPQYFIMSGTKAFEGAVVTIDRLGKHSKATPPIMNVSNGSDGWHLLQTNDDLNGPPGDQRRPIANGMLSWATQDIVTEDNLMDFMRSSPLDTPTWTAFTTVMCPATGYYKTMLPDKEPHLFNRSLFTKAPKRAPKLKLLAEVTSAGASDEASVVQLPSLLATSPRIARKRRFLSRHVRDMA
jgi:hypothetical protein